VIGVPPDERRSRVERINFAVDDRGAGGVVDGPGELWGEEGAVEGREDGGRVVWVAPRAGCREKVVCLAFLSAVLVLKAVP